MTHSYRLHEPTHRPPRAVLGLLSGLILSIALAIPSSAQQGDSFFESDLDGAWAGTIEVNGLHYPLQLNANVGGEGGVAFLVLPDTLDGAPSSLDVLEATVDRVSGRDLDLTVDTLTTQADRVARLSLELTHDPATDELAGPVSGAAKGVARLVRISPDRLAQRVWSASIRIAGAGTPLLLQLEEGASGRGRFRVESVAGQAWLGAEQGAVEGTRNGKSLDLTLRLPSGDVTAALKLARKNTQLKGALTVDGARVSAKLKAAGGSGKPMKAKGASPVELPAGQATVVTVTGSNLTAGAVAHVDNAGALVSGVEHRSSKAIEVTITPDAALAAGTRLSLRVVNGDGQVAEPRTSLTVSDGGGGGTAVSFAADVQPIFTQNCALAGCHSAASAASGMILAAGEAYSNIVNAPSLEQPSLLRIAPGNADGSYLVRKIRGTAGISGGRMPLNRTPLTAAQIATIVDWANQGAANNRLPR